MEQSYKCRIYPNTIQQQAIAKAFGCARWIYNHFLTKSEEAIKNKQPRPSRYECAKELAELKKAAGTEWLAEPDKYAVANAIVDLDRAYKNHFANPAHFALPIRKSKKNAKQSYRTNFVAYDKSNRQIGNIEVDYDGQQIKLPKLGWVKASISREPEGRILNAAISRTAADEYYAAITCTDVEFEQYPSTGKSVGIDAGLKELMTLSDGEIVHNNRRADVKRRKLARLQRDLSRKDKGSNNYRKQKLKIAKAHRDVVNQRNDDIHKATTKLVQEYDVIAIEDVSVKNMMQNHRLAGAISDAAWREIRRQLEYKCYRHGRTLIIAPRDYASTQLCSFCGCKNTDVKGVSNLGMRTWLCPHCGTHLDRDINAAVNLLALAQ